MSRPSVLAICGPTAAGKSAVALRIAEEWGAVLLSADAMQVYRGMNIGTASPTAQERQRAPHIGVDVIDPNEQFSAAEFMAVAEPYLADARPVVVVGGTALYIRALIRGLARTPAVNPELRAELSRRTDLHEALTAVDPELAARLHPNDRMRLVRGLEVFEQGGVPLSTLQRRHQATPDLLHATGVWLDRSNLQERIDERVLRMVETGLVSEVEALLQAGFTRDLKSMRTLGYRHLCDHLLDGLPIEVAISRTQRDTRQFARKQRTWRKHLGFAEARNEHMAAGRAAAQRVFGPNPRAHTGTIRP
ncbi:MAG: tRNA (adenosine(37)-N6)-dimethylallyltransferase MiaA [Myxococcota bacterium]